MPKKGKIPSRQVRRASERRRTKQLAKKEREQNGNQNSREPQKSDEPKRAIDWKSGSSIITAVVKAAEFIRDTFFQ